MEAYEALLSSAPPEYLVHRTWPSRKTPKEVEIVRAAMIEERSVGDGDYNRFEQRLHDARARLG